MLDLSINDLHAHAPDEIKHCPLDAPHDRPTLLLSLFLCAGVVISYLPQHWRIIKNKTGEGISAAYLLLGATSSACALLNIVTLQFGVIRCCTVWSPFGCFENVLGILQIFLQWLMFNIILALYLYYYPPHLKFAFVTRVNRSQAQLFPGASSSSSRKHRPSLASKLGSYLWPGLSDPVFADDGPDSSTSAPRRRRHGSGSSASSASDEFDPTTVLLPSMAHKSQVGLTAEYRQAIGVSILVALHLLVSVFITFLLLLVSPKYGNHEPGDPDHPGFPHNHSTKIMLSWASCLGLLATLLATIQYIPQLWHTSSTRLVGSLSIPTMLIQTPGSFVFVYSYVANGGRPGTNWTTWLVFLVTGTLQGILLVMCCLWKLRQKAAGIDDYGRDLDAVNPPTRSERRALLASTRTRGSSSA